MVYQFTSFELDAASLTLRARGRPIDLPPKAVETLAALIAREGAVATKPELMDQLWPDGFVEEANLSQYIYLLRRAFREHGLPDVIVTHPRRGYSFDAPKEPVPRRAAHSRWLAHAAAVAAILLVAGAARFTVPRPALSGEALQAYSLGRYYWNLRSAAGMQRSVAYFKRVVALAPSDARGYAAMADAYTELADLEWPCARCAAWGRDAKRLASRALAVDPRSVEAHVAYGMAARIFDGDDRIAAAEFQRALALDPNDALANQWYGNLLIAHGNLGDGIARLRLAANEQPISTATYAWLARGYYYERRYAEAERYAREALALEPQRLETTVLLGLSEEARGEYAWALRHFTAASRLGASSDEVKALRAGIDAATGKRAAAVTELGRLAARRDLDDYAARDVAIGYAIANDAPAARAVLSNIRFHSRLESELVRLDPNLNEM